MNIAHQITAGLTEVLIQIYQVTGDLGIAIIVFTLALRLVLLPLTIPSLKAQNKIKELQPELKKLKAKHKNDKQKQQLAQMELYKKYNVNPLSGCLPQILQIAVIFFLYRAFITFLSHPEVAGVAIDTTFLWMNLSQPDPWYILPILAAGVQLILSLMIAPGGEVRDIESNTSKSKKKQQANEKEEDMAEMAASMQQQMLFLFPIMTGFFAATFPSGIALYWVFTNVFSIVQQYYISGWGGLTTYPQRAWAQIQSFTSKQSTK